MLSWSSNDQGDTVDLAALASGEAGVGVVNDTELVEFATECAGTDDDALAAVRARLVDATDEAFMVDAAAVAANFEMMTRLADSTGASMPADVLERRAAQIDVMNVAHLTSRR